MTEPIPLLHQQNLLALLAHDDEYGKLVAQGAPPALFEGDYRIIAERCIDYWRRMREAPKVHTPDLLGDILSDPHNKKGPTYRRTLMSMAQLSVEGINAKYVLGQLRSFTRLQKLKGAILQAAEILNQSQETSVAKAEEVLATILRARDYQFMPGIRLHDIDKLLAHLDTHYFEFETGIKELDHRQVVPSRGATMLLLGGAGRGKTWALVHIGKRALLRRRRVLHISLEMSEEDLMQRYFQALCSVTKREMVVDVTTLDIDRQGNLRGFGSARVTPDFHFQSKELRLELGARIKLFGERTFDNLLLKRFPPRTLSMDDLRMYLDSLESVEGFIPDMVILDYIGIAKTDANNYRVTLGRAFEEFRAVMVERNMAGVTAQQISKQGVQSNLANATHVAEDWSMIATADTVITYSATDLEQRHGLARLYAAKARSEEDKFGVLITQNYKIGQFVLDSMLLRQAPYTEQLDRLTGHDSMSEQPQEDNDDDDASD